MQGRQGHDAMDMLQWLVRKMLKIVLKTCTELVRYMHSLFSTLVLWGGDYIN